MMGDVRIKSYKFSVRVGFEPANIGCRCRRTNSK